MSDVIQTLLNLRSLRATAREMTLEELQEGLQKLQSVVAEREEAEAEERAKNKEREQKLQAYRDMLAAEGISPEELLAMLDEAPKSKRAPRPAKYKFMVDGEERTWTGQGRMPAPLKEAIEKEGKSLDDFLI
ncbi:MULTISPECIES: H-NS family nucleoid-associated regulatory protein [Photobacterium]|uniref:DNA-binding protein n=1 Tax=Photobacterium ganghwense TaxID=320778 RepID=A0A0J1HFV5_9GAMM|nr:MULTISPECIES: H-NS family nucleoid-associated regulatory protein [Photobacterium]KLV10500.1 transcriptional regulator [Photobacterium ganghwense]MBV1841255.1 H-NS histone family protein [Photobacterium ganghwense]PSU09597.1 transcriptional regulator [Photobacterium ganghwense]QSV16843.1 H-NS histone family protein [Photobacterium ganghwense]